MISLPTTVNPPAAEAPLGVEAAWATAALFDLSSTGKILLTGPDAPQFLHNICTNDINGLPVGGGCEAYLLDPRAKVQFAIWVFHVLQQDGSHALEVETTPGRNEALIRYLDRFLISEAVEMMDQTTQLSQFHLAGPQAKAYLQGALGQPLPALTEFLHVVRPLGSCPAARIRCRDRLNLPGYDIVVPANFGPNVSQRLIRFGAVPLGDADFHALRVEAGTPEYGIDIDETRFVMEVARVARAVSYEKGCFPGQEPIVMARDRAGFINRAFLRLVVKSDSPLPRGVKLFHENQEVGIVTDSAISPRTKRPVAMGYVKRGFQSPGQLLEARDGNAVTPVEIVGPPIMS